MKIYRRMLYEGLVLAGCTVVGYPTVFQLVPVFKLYDLLRTASKMRPKISSVAHGIRRRRVRLVSMWKVHRDATFSYATAAEESLT
jgi:hypothetical protein